MWSVGHLIEMDHFAHHVDAQLQTLVCRLKAMDSAKRPSAEDTQQE